MVFKSALTEKRVVLLSKGMIRFVTFGAASVAYSFIGDGFGKVECLGRDPGVL